MRVATLGIYDRGYIAGTAAAVNVAPFTEKLGALDAERLIFETIVQSGIDRLKLPPLPDGIPEPPLSPFLAERIQPIDGAVTGLSMIAIEAAFAKYLPRDFRNDRRYAPVVQLMCFLGSLFAAAHGRGALLSVSGVPSSASLAGLLPPELALPVTALLSSLEPAEVPVATGFSIERRLAAVSQEILNSRVYDSYVAAHGILDDPDRPVAEGLVLVKQATDELTRKNRRSLRQASLPLSLLPLAASIADVFAGGLLGHVGDSVADWLRSALDQRKRLLVYDFSKVPRLLLEGRLEMLSKHHGGTQL